MKPWRLAFLALLVAAHSLLAQPVLRLKGIGAKADMQEPSALGGAEALKAGTHTIVQMEEHADLKEALDELIRRGARVVAYVPDGAALVWTEEAIPLDGLPVAWAGELRSGWKLSGELVYAGAMTVVAEFHPDVDIELARTRAVGLGLAIREHPDLAAGHLIVTGEPDQIWRLAELDETAYVYPVSPELAGGEAVHACASAITAVGPVGQYVATVGDGWDGPGRGAAALSFVFGPLTDRLSAEQSKSEIRRAFDAWSSVAAIDFQEATGTGLQRSIAILFGEGDHGDGYPFDGPGRGLAHTFFPAPPNPEPIAGDMHLDGAEPWRAGADVDLFSVALHELGHALGLGHSDRPGAVMYPYYRQAAGLTAEDIAAIRTLYAARETNPSEPPPQPPPPAPSAPLALTVTPPASPVRLASVVVQGSAAGGSGSVRVTWVSDRGGTGWLDLPVAAGTRLWRFDSVPLAVGLNRISVVATDGAAARVAREFLVTREEAPPEPPVLRIATVAGRVSTPAITLEGTAAHSSGIGRVLWVNDRGGSGQASGTTSWRVPAITLQPGLNRLTVTAYAIAGATKSAVLTMELVTRDTTAPSLTVIAPSGASTSTSDASIAIRGTARDDVGVVEVTWESSTGARGTAPGTTSWGPATVPLLVGTNRITVRAKDAAGNIAWRAITVTRK